MKPIQEKLFSKILSSEEKIKYARRHIEDMIDYLRSTKTTDVQKEIKDFREWLIDRDLPEDIISDLVKEFSDKLNVKENKIMKNQLVESANKYLIEDVITETKVSEYKMLVVHMAKEVEEDSYEQGALGKRQLQMDEKIGKIFDSMLDFKDYCEKTWGLENNGDSWTVIDNRLIYQRQEDGDGNEVSPKDPVWKEFVAGKINLWIADYDFMVQLIREPIIDEDAVREWTGIQN